MLPLIDRLPGRRVSLGARWALRFAVFLPLLAGLSVLAHRGGLIDTPTFVILIVLCGVICMVGLCLFAVGLRSLWVRGTAGGRRLSWALFLFMPFIALYLAAALAYMIRPALSDVSTDPINPPPFAAELRAGGADAAALAAARAPHGDLCLSGLRFKAPLDATRDVFGQVAAGLRWRRVRQRGRIGADDELFVEYSYRTPVLAMPVNIVVRATDEGDTTFIDVRSRLGHLRHDLGLNAWIVGRFLADLDYAMIGVAEP